MSLEPDQADLLFDAIEGRLVDLHTIKVGRIQSYDSDKQVADIVPVMRRPFNVGDNEVDHEDLPVIPNVPVVWPRAGGFVMHMPLAKGDHVVIGFTDDNIAQWRQTGSISKPDDLRRHDLGSAICFPGVSHMRGVLSINPLDIAARVAGMTLGEDGTVRQICWSSGGITVGRQDPVTQRVSPVALADRTDARVAALEAQVGTLTTTLTALITTVGGVASAAGSHVHPVAAAPGTTGVAPSPPAAPGAPPPAFVPVPLTTAADTLKGTGPLP